MSLYRVETHRQVEKYLSKLEDESCAKLTAVIDSLSTDPRPYGCLKLTGVEPPAWRVRVGNYRIVYEIIDKDHYVWIRQIERRRERTYKKD